MLGKRLRPWAFAPLLAACLGLGGCTTPDDVAVARQGASVAIDSARIKKFYDEQQAIYTQLASLAGTGVGAEEQNRIFLRAGYNYIDRNCEAYFNALTRIQRDRKTITAEVALIGAAASGVMAAVDAAAKAIALVGIGTGLTAATIDTITSGVLYELDASATRSLTFRAMTVYQAADGASPETITNFADAVAILQGYGAICMPPSIEALVKDAVKTAQPEDLAQSPGKELFATAVGSGRLVELASSVGEASLAPDQREALYWLFALNGASDPKIVKDLLPKFTGSLGGRLFAKDAAGNDVVKAGIDQQRIQRALAGVAEIDGRIRGNALAARKKYVEAAQRAAASPSVPAATVLAVPGAAPPALSSPVAPPNALDTLNSVRQLAPSAVRPMIGVR